MLHEFLQKGERVINNFGNAVYLTDKRLIKTNKTTHFEDLNLSSIEAVELDIGHYELFLRIGSSLLILYTLFLLLGTVEFLAGLGVNFGTVSTVSLILGVGFLVAYFVLHKRVTRIYGSNKVMSIAGHDWDVISTIRHHSLQSQKSSKKDDEKE
ncbi:MAG: hypothetical protein KC535_03655 [Nanoarchaeota archaeon]|nr:hypothetical protein [Nanoarchaeota archaeon]